MIDRPRMKTWPAAVAEAAHKLHIQLPEVTQQGMGSVLWRNSAGDRLVSFKRRFVALSAAENAGVEWTLWRENDDYPSPVLAFHESLLPTQERAEVVVSVLQGWLQDNWTDEKAKFEVEKQSGRVEAIQAGKPANAEYWLSDDHAVGVVVENNGWKILWRGNSLSSWRLKSGESRGDCLSPAQLDGLSVWLANNWYVIAYGNDYRPARLRQFGAVASRAFEDAQLQATAQESEELSSWWARHAVRAADCELPNIFFERQADDVVVSWDASPTKTRFYMIPYGEEVLSARFSVPILRHLVVSRLKALDLPKKEQERMLASMSADATAGYKVITSTYKSINKEWLARHYFSDSDAREVALTGTSRHPILGLLRSAQGGTLSATDYETILGMLRPSTADSYQKLRQVAKGMNSGLDIREPWESGYHLARLVRGALGQATPGCLDIEKIVVEMGVDVRDTTLTDSATLAACVGSSMYAPLMAINSSCAAASGVSGRRITLAHELCHLLFDRSRIQSFARFEGGGADSDRLIEMRANAFAVELLAPMSTLVREDGTLLEVAELAKLAVILEVSFAALQKHAKNLQNRQVASRY